MTDADRLRAAGLRASPARLAIVGESGTGGGRHRLVCRGCGATADVDCTVRGSSCLGPEADAGFTVERTEVTFRGLCPRCRRWPAGPGTGPVSRPAGN